MLTKKIEVIGGILLIIALSAILSNAKQSFQLEAMASAVEEYEITGYVAICPSNGEDFMVPDDEFIEDKNLIASAEHLLSLLSKYENDETNESLLEFIEALEAANEYDDDLGNNFLENKKALSSYRAYLENTMESGRAFIGEQYCGTNFNSFPTMSTNSMMDAAEILPVDSVICREDAMVVFNGDDFIAERQKIARVQESHNIINNFFATVEKFDDNLYDVFVGRDPRIIGFVQNILYSELILEFIEGTIMNEMELTSEICYFYTQDGAVNPQ